MSAIISDCGRYRYELRRQIGTSEKSCVFIMLNPSTADAELDDPTIRRCKGFAERLGCGELIVVNLFAFRATKPKELFSATDPVGELNQKYVMSAIGQAANNGGVIVCAWGAHGKLMEQDETVLGWVWGRYRPSIEGRYLPDCEIKAYCLGITKDGFPKHPLYLPNDSKLIEYKGRAAQCVEAGE